MPGASGEIETKIGFRPAGIVWLPVIGVRTPLVGSIVNSEMLLVPSLAV